MKKKTTNEFIVEAVLIHGDKYLYSLVVYINTNTKIKIICPIHGEFEQTPNNHLKGKGCVKCARDKNNFNKTKTTESFINEANIIHNYEYNYDNFIYIKSNKRSYITCKIHGDFLQTPNNHLKGKGCRECSYINKIKKIENFIKEANFLHKNKYYYEKFIYVDSKTKGKITCKIHGDFLQNPNTHLNNHGCKKCGDESQWGRSNFIKKANNRICSFYVIKCYNENEKFYKIGITMNSIDRRYSNKIPYKYEIINEIRDKAGIIWDLELKEKRKLKYFRYQPLLSFHGSKTECFSKFIL